MRTAPILVILALSVGGQWDGAPYVVMPRQTAVIPQTPNGSVILTAENLAAQNNAGSIMVRSAGGAPVMVTVPALRHQPSFLVQNFAAQDLAVTNTSNADETPIRLQEVGTGIPGTTPVTLPTDGSVIPLAPGETGSTLAVPRFMRLQVTNGTGNVSDLIVIGGPVDASGNNAFVFEVNSAQNTGPGTNGPNAPAPPPFNATTTGNTYVLPFNWGSSTIFIANVSPQTAGPVAVSLQAL